MIARYAAALVIDARDLRPDDWRLWRELRLAALAEAPGAFGSTLAEWSGPGDTEARWRARLTNVPLNTVFSIDGAHVGMVGAAVTGDEVELLSLWVAPWARARGVGDAAVEHVIRWAGERRVVLSVKADNAPALRLYARHGFRDAGVSPDDRCERLFRR
jgi:ribosomal protein S18 acetylase RimI-like enzyme